MSTVFIVKKFIALFIIIYYFMKIIVMCKKAHSTPMLVVICTAMLV